MNGVRIVELRQYTLLPDQRDVLIDLFDREFVEPQEATGMTIIGQFRDLDDPDRFVWLRGFDDMPTRAHALGRFYGGPVWKAHSNAANETMIDCDDVLLLRPVAAHTGFPTPAEGRASVDHGTPPPSAVLATIYYADHPFGPEFTDFFDEEIRPALIETGATPMACLWTEYASNSFPALPVREDENAFVWLARFASPADLDSHLHDMGQSARWRDRIQPRLSTMLARPPQRLRLTPTARSWLR